MKRKIISIAMAVLMMISVPLVSSAQIGRSLWQANHGECGENAKWEYDEENHILKIYGSGDMYDYGSFSEVPWDSFGYYSVEISSGITGIGSYSFRFAKQKEINIPDTVTRIGKNAFFHWTGPTSLVIPDSVETIEENAFYSCNTIKEITFGKGLKTIADGAFIGWSALEKVNVTDLSAWCNIEFGDYESNPLFHARQFYVNGERVTDLVIPDGVTDIKDVSFYNCLSIVKVTVPESVKSIGGYAFYNCERLNDIVLPRSLKKIEAYAFDYCKALRDVYYADDEILWNNINIEKDGNDALFNADLNFGEHIHVYDTAVVTDPTCTERGYTTYSCICGKSYIDDYVDALGHTPGEWESEKEPTAAVNGTRIRKCTVCGEVAEREDIPSLFRDIPENEWFTDAVIYCFRNGYMYLTQQEERRFSPHIELTRAQMVQILAQVAKAELEKNAESVTFRDVPSGEWYTAAVEWAYGNGLTAGVGDGYFSPDAKVTREQLAVFLMAYAKKINCDISAFADIEEYADKDDVSWWAVDAIRWAIANDMIHGVSKTAISPGSFATRAQTAVIIKAVTENVIEDKKPGLLENLGLSLSVYASQDRSQVIAPGNDSSAHIRLYITSKENDPAETPEISLKVSAEGETFIMTDVAAQYNGNGAYDILIGDEYVKSDYTEVLFENNEKIAVTVTVIIGEESETFSLDVAAGVNE